MKCEFPAPCAQDAEVRVGMTRPSLPVCRIHAAVIVWKLMMENASKPTWEQLILSPIGW